MEANAVPSAKSLLLLFCAAPAGKTRSSVPSPMGATSPAQFAAVIQFASPPPPSHVDVANSRRLSSDSIDRACDRRARALWEKERNRRPCRELLPIREILFTAGVTLLCTRLGARERSTTANSTGGGPPVI